MVAEVAWRALNNGFSLDQQSTEYFPVKPFPTAPRQWCRFVKEATINQDYTSIHNLLEFATASTIFERSKLLNSTEIVLTRFRCRFNVLEFYLLTVEKYSEVLYVNWWSSQVKALFFIYIKCTTFFKVTFSLKGYFRLEKLIRNRLRSTHRIFAKIILQFAAHLSKVSKNSCIKELKLVQRFVSLELGSDLNLKVSAVELRNLLKLPPKKIRIYYNCGSSSQILKQAPNDGQLPL